MESSCKFECYDVEQGNRKVTFYFLIVFFTRAALYCWLKLLQVLTDFHSSFTLRLGCNAQNL